MMTCLSLLCPQAHTRFTLVLENPRQPHPGATHRPYSVICTMKSIKCQFCRANVVLLSFLIPWIIICKSSDARSVPSSLASRSQTDFGVSGLQWSNLCLIVSPFDGIDGTMVSRSGSDHDIQGEVIRYRVSESLRHVNKLIHVMLRSMVSSFGCRLRTDQEDTLGGLMSSLKPWLGDREY